MGWDSRALIRPCNLTSRKKQHRHREYRCVIIAVDRKAPAVLENWNGKDEQISPESRCWHMASYQMEHFLPLRDKEIEDRTTGNITQKQNLTEGTQGSIKVIDEEATRWGLIKWFKNGADWKIQGGASSGPCGGPLETSPQLPLTLKESCNVELFLVD